MKKASNIFVSIILLISTTGVIVNKHYSGSKLYDIAFFVEANSCCTTECDCCENEVEVYQLQIDILSGLITQLSEQITSFRLLFTSVSKFINNTPINSFSEFLFTPDPKPRTTNQPLKY